MNEALHFHDFQIDRNEHQLEPEDRATATYMVTNRCDCVVVTSINISHLERTDVSGRTTLECVPAVVEVAGPLGPNETRQVSVELVTRGELPGRHPLRLQATYSCRPFQPTVDAVMEVSVAAD